MLPRYTRASQNHARRHPVSRSCHKFIIRYGICGVLSIRWSQLDLGHEHGLAIRRPLATNHSGTSESMGKHDSGTLPLFARTARPHHSLQSWQKTQSLRRANTLSLVLSRLTAPVVGVASTCAEARGLGAGRMSRSWQGVDSRLEALNRNEHNAHRERRATLE